MHDATTNSQEPNYSILLVYTQLPLAFHLIMHFSHQIPIPQVRSTCTCVHACVYPALKFCEYG